jgi:hypothetical protein
MVTNIIVQLYYLAQRIREKGKQQVKAFGTPKGILKLIMKTQF